MYVLHRNNIGNIGKSRHTCTNRAIATRCDKISKNEFQTGLFQIIPDIFTKTGNRYDVGQLQYRAKKKKKKKKKKNNNNNKKIDENNRAPDFVVRRPNNKE